MGEWWRRVRWWCTWSLGYRLCPNSWQCGVGGEGGELHPSWRRWAGPASPRMTSLDASQNQDAVSKVLVGSERCVQWLKWTVEGGG